MGVAANRTVAVTGPPAARPARRCFRSVAACQLREGRLLGKPASSGAGSAQLMDRLAPAGCAAPQTGHRHAGVGAVLRPDPPRMNQAI